MSPLLSLECCSQEYSQHTVEMSERRQCQCVKCSCLAVMQAFTPWSDPCVAVTSTPCCCRNEHILLLLKWAVAAELAEPFTGCEEHLRLCL